MKNTQMIISNKHPIHPYRSIYPQSSQIRLNDCKSLFNKNSIEAIPTDYFKTISGTGFDKTALSSRARGEKDLVNVLNTIKQIAKGLVRSTNAISESQSRMGDFTKTKQYVKSKGGGFYIGPYGIPVAYTSMVKGSEKKETNEIIKKVYRKISTKPGLSHIWKGIKEYPIIINLLNINEKVKDPLPYFKGSGKGGWAGQMVVTKQDEGYGVGVVQKVNHMYALSHELGHSIMYAFRKFDSDKAETVKELYEAAKKSGKYGNQYAMSRDGEYFAEGTKNWFKSKESRRWLRDNDPKFYSFLSTIYNNPDKISSGQNESINPTQPANASSSTDPAHYSQFTKKEMRQKMNRVIGRLRTDFSKFRCNRYIAIHAAFIKKTNGEYTSSLAKLDSRFKKVSGINLTPEQNDPTPIPEPTPTPNLPTYGKALIAGVQKDKWGTTCPGSKKDTETWSQILKEYDQKIVLNQNATKDAILKNIKQAAKELTPGETFVFSYTGHGGSSVDKNGDEVDGKDELLCLYDSNLIDDELWNALSRFKKGVNVFIAMDTCHSGTNADIGKADSDDANFIQISGCPDNASSYGNNGGGVLTNAIAEMLKKNNYSNYNVFFKDVQQKVQNVENNQKPVLSSSGPDVDDFLGQKPLDIA